VYTHHHIPMMYIIKSAILSIHSYTIQEETDRKLKVSMAGFLPNWVPCYQVWVPCYTCADCVKINNFFPGI